MRTLNDIVPPSRRKEAGVPTTPDGKGPLNVSTNQRHKFPYTTLGVVALIIIVSIGVLFYFSVAKIKIVPNTVSVAVESSFSADKSDGTLPFMIVTAQKVASQSVKGSGTKTVSSSASGTITIYNTQPKSQTLVATTRFATASGLIFRIPSVVTVPGGSPEKPGSTTAKVNADKAGDSYNVGPTSFTVPGFAGTSLSGKVYAKSTSTMTGGASGEVPVVDATLETQARDTLKTALASDLLASIQAQVPSGYVLVPGSTVTTYQEVTSVPSSTTGMVDVKEQGTATTVVFPNVALARAVALSVPNLKYQGEQLTLVSTNNLLLATADMPEPESEKFSFTLAGTATLMYTVDQSRIAAAVAGKTLQAAEVAVSSYPEVKRAVITLRPFWRQTFPQDPASIQVVVDGL